MSDQSTPDTATQDSYVLTLVHGTFSRRAPWTRQGSAFTKALVDNLTGPVLHVERYKWSGRNSLGSRYKATEKLGVTLRNLKRRYPEARHYVIGHSHGGAIAYYATAHVDVLDGVICLSTPFLNIFERPYSELVLGALHWGLMLLLPLIGASMGYVAATGVDTAGPLWAIGLGGVCLGAAIGLLSHVLLFSFILHQRSFITRLIWPHTKGDVLIVRMPGDEASLTLGLANCVSWLWSLVVSIGFLPMVWSQRLCKKLVAKWKPGLQSWANVVFILFQSIYLLLMVPLLLPCVLVSIIPFGLGFALHALFVEINVDTTPHGVWKVCCIPIPRSSLLLGLRHSSYEHPDVIKILGDWIETREVVVNRNASPRPRWSPD
jgi:hypothetical protein